MSRITYQSGDCLGPFVELDGKAASPFDEMEPEPGVWIALCSGPSHPGEKREFRLITRDVYYRRPKAFGCPDCLEAVVAWMRSNNIRTYGDRPAALRYTRPPSPLHGLTFGRLQIDEWLPRTGWGCNCLCGCGEYEVARNTQAMLQLSIRPCPVTGRVRPATGCTVTYRDGQPTVISNTDTNA